MHQNHSTFDLIGRDKGLQEQWLRRFVALIIDAIIIAVVVWVLSILKGFFWFFGWSFLFGVLLLIYSALLESMRGATIGKELVKLRIVSHQGNMDIGKALMRNISKIHVLLLLLDFLIGFFTPGNDPKQRWLDRIVNTTVENVQSPNLYTRPTSDYKKDYNINK